MDDLADAVAIKKLEAVAEQDEADQKQMDAVAQIEEKEGKDEEADSKKTLKDAEVLEAAATEDLKDKEDSAKAELKDPEDVTAADKAAVIEKKTADRDVMSLKEVAGKEELDSAATEKDAAQMEQDAKKIGETGKEDLTDEEADSKALEAAGEQEEAKQGKNVTALAATTLATTGRCGPQTKIHLPLTKDADSWSDPFAANKAHPIGRYDVKQAKICGPGTFTFSPTSCGRMDYKPDIFEVSTKEASGCKVVDLKWCSVGGLGCMMVDC